MHITHAQEQDAADILALQRLAYQSEAALYPTSPIPPLMQTLEEMQQDMQAQCVLVAKLEEQIVGSVRVYELAHIETFSETRALLGRIIT